MFRILRQIWLNFSLGSESDERGHHQGGLLLGVLRLGKRMKFGGQSTLYRECLNEMGRDEQSKGG